MKAKELKLEETEASHTVIKHITGFLLIQIKKTRDSGGKNVTLEL
jgi:hypothetical protein